MTNATSNLFLTTRKASITQPPPKPTASKMPREEYQVPTANAGQRGGTRDDHQVRHVMSYICGDCGGSVTLGKDATVACPHCAGRVLYKERTKRMVQFEAR
ncbi:DNA-directed RNA polymerase and III subunit RPABC4 [Fusarium sp. NRRL 25303]|nr:DNA-directed RNA polymerase and III subunit RPABC4 [Fusarium sp. NRRL 25303]